MPTNVLRGLGPKTFISYSFKDSALANQLREHLIRAGFQVTMEDETSLVNTRLAEVLPRRIAEAEFFVQLRTPTSNRSYWVEQELDLAIKRHSQGDGFVLVPVVTDPYGLSDKAKEWVFLDASGSILTDPLLDALVKAGLKSIRTIGLDEQIPTLLNDACLDKALDDAGDRRRVLLDPDTFWFDRSDDLIRWAEADDNEAFVRQERERRRLLAWTFERADVGIHCLLRELRNRIELGLLRQADAHAVAHAFYRRLIANTLGAVLASLANTKAIELSSRTAEDLSDLLDKSKWSGDFESHAAMWALKRVSDIRFKDWRQKFVQTELGAERSKKLPARVFFPVDVLGADWEEMLSFPTDPRGYINEYDWAIFGLPQVAARAVWSASRFDQKDKLVAFEAIDQGTGWALSDFEVIGRP